jgi:hypothetical protein
MKGKVAALAEDKKVGVKLLAEPFIGPMVDVQDLDIGIADLAAEVSPYQGRLPGFLPMVGLEVVGVGQQMKVVLPLVFKDGFKGFLGTVGNSGVVVSLYVPRKAIGKPHIPEVARSANPDFLAKTVGIADFRNGPVAVQAINPGKEQVTFLNSPFAKVD